MHPLDPGPRPLPTPERARRNLAVGAVVLAVVAVVTIVAVPLGIRGKAVARFEQIETTLQGTGEAADIGERVVELRTAPISRLRADATTTVELVGESASRAKIALSRDGGWIEGDAPLVAGPHEAKEGLAVRVWSVDSGQDDDWDGVVTVRLTVSQGLLPDIDEVDLDLAAS